MPVPGLELAPLEGLAWSIARAVLVSAPLGELAPKCPDLLKSCRYVAQHCRDSDDPRVAIAEGQDRELDGDPPAVFSQRRSRNACFRSASSPKNPPSDAPADYRG